MTSTVCKAADFDFMQKFIITKEGNIRHMYVPKDAHGNPLDKSGPTIGAGFDAGQHSPAEIRAMPGLPPELAEKLVPYARMRGEEAVAFIKEHPLRLDRAEIDCINKSVLTKFISAVSVRTARELTRITSARKKNPALPAPAVASFAEFPAKAQTALVSLLYQHGPNSSLGGPVIEAMLYGDCRKAGKELRAIAAREGYKYPSRRKAEAELMEAAGLGKTFPPVEP